MVIVTVSWIDAGKADYALGGTLPVLCVSDDPRQFGFMYDERVFAGREALIVAAAGRADWLTRAAAHFRRVFPAPDIVVRRASGAAALTLHTAFGYGYEPRSSRTPNAR